MQWNEVQPSISLEKVEDTGRWRRHKCPVRQGSDFICYLFQLFFLSDKSTLLTEKSSIICMEMQEG